MGGAFVLVLLFSAMAGLSDAASWCVCKSDVGDPYLQKSLDWACGNGADCSPVNQNGACYQPNSVRGHCSYAVNSYYQKQGQSPTACVFGNTTTVVSADPSSGTCSFPSSASSSRGSTTPGGSTNSSSFTPLTPSTNFGLGPSSSTIDSNSGARHLLPAKITYLFTFVTLTVMVLFG